MSKELTDFSAFVDFRHPLALGELAKLLSKRLFGGIRFIGMEEGIWDENPAVRLESDFLGLRIELGGEGGASGGFTLQVEPFKLPPKESESSLNYRHGDLSWYVRFLLERVEDVEIEP